MKCICLICDVSKINWNSRMTHSDIHGRTPEHEIIIHHGCIVIPSVSTKAARRCADDLKGQSVVDPAAPDSTSTSSMSIGIIDIPLFGQLSGQSVDDFSSMRAEGTIRAHHEGFEGAATV